MMKPPGDLLTFNEDTMMLSFWIVRLKTRELGTVIAKDLLKFLNSSRGQKPIMVRSGRGLAGSTPRSEMEALENMVGKTL